MRMLRSGRSLESAVAVEPPTRPVPPSTRTRALERGLLGAAGAVAVEDAAAGGVRSGMHALTMAAMLLHWTGFTRGGLSHPCQRGEERVEPWVRDWVRGCSLVAYVEACGPSSIQPALSEAKRNE